jgi:hypothetical protein
MGHDPYKIHRKVRRTDALSDRTMFTTKSFTEEKEDEYTPVIEIEGNLNDCRVECIDCPDFNYRCVRYEPRITSHPDYFCKHIIRAILTEIRNGTIVVTPERRRELVRASRRKTRENRLPHLRKSQKAAGPKPSASNPSATEKPVKRGRDLVTDAMVQAILNDPDWARF